MDDDKINVTFNCPKCGADPATLHFEEDVVTDDCIATCKDCGVSFGEYGSIKAKAKAVAAAELKNMVRKSLKKSGLKFK